MWPTRIAKSLKKEQQHVSAVLVKGESETGSPAHRLASVLPRGYAVLVLSDKSAEFTANPLKSDAFFVYDYRLCARE